MAIVIGDWGLGFGIAIGEWDWGLGLGIGIGDSRGFKGFQQYYFMLQYCNARCLVQWEQISQIYTD